MQFALTNALTKTLSIFVFANVLFALSACATRFDVQGHRGARGLAPENTLPAFSKALDLNVNTLELDIGITADDVVVIAHDPQLNANITRDQQGVHLEKHGARLRSMTYAQLSQFDVGKLKPGSTYANQFPDQVAVDKTPMPRLSDLFALVKQRNNTSVRFNIETKIRPDRPAETADPETFVRLLLAVIREHGMQGRVSIQSFDWRTLRLVQSQAPNIPTVYLTAQQSWLNNVMPKESINWLAGLRLDLNTTVPQLVAKAGGKVWSPYYRDLSSASLQQAQGLGLKVIPWTINSPSEMKQFIEMGVDGIITDRPDLLKLLIQ